MQRYLKAGLIVLLGLSVLGFYWTAVLILRFPYVVDYGEAPLVDQSSRILASQAVYKNDFSVPPYVIANYPPIYPLLQAKLSQLTGAPVLLSGRILSFLATLGSAGILASLAKSLTGGRFFALIASGLFLGHPYVISWSALARVDLLALLFCLTAVMILYHRWYSWKWVCLALICLLASIYTRQSYLLAGPLGALSWLWSRDRRRAGIFAALLGSTVVIIFMALNTITNGGFSLNIIQANMNKYRLDILGDWIKQLALIWPVILGGNIAFSYLYFRNYLRQIDTSIDPFFLRGWMVFTIGTFISSLTAGKVGSGANYFIELIATSSVISAVALYYVQKSRVNVRTIVYLMICVQLIWLLAGSISLNRATYNNTWIRLEWYDQLANQVNVASKSGPVLSDDYMGMVLNAGQSIYYQPFEYGQLYQAKLWEPQMLANEIQDGEFPLILIGGDTLNKPCCWPPELVDAIQERYLIDYQSDVIVCVPKPSITR